MITPPSSDPGLNWLEWALGIVCGIFTAGYGGAITQNSRRVDRLQEQLKQMGDDGRQETRQGDDKLWVELASLRRQMEGYHKEAYEMHLKVAAQLGAIPTRDELHAEINRLLSVRPNGRRSYDG